MSLDPAYLTSLMQLALEQAELALAKGEVPIGAVIASETEIIATAHNEVETLKDATAHAEILAIRRASEKLGNWRLGELLLCVTLEPCTMCTGALKQSRIGTVIYGAPDPRAGALGSIYDLSQNPPKIRVISGIEENRCLAILKGFFEKRRRDGREAEGA